MKAFLGRAFFDRPGLLPGFDTGLLASVSPENLRRFFGDYFLDSFININIKNSFF